MNLCEQLPVAGHKQYQCCEFVRFEQQECHLLEDSKNAYGCRPVENMQLKKGNLLRKRKIIISYMKLQCMVKQDRRCTYDVTLRYVQIFAFQSLLRCSYYLMHGVSIGVCWGGGGVLGLPSYTLMSKRKWFCVSI
jgi:hypothetical protein